MAKPARKTNGQSNGSSGKNPAKAEGVAPYFRPIFLANRKLLKTRSNKELLERWLADHPGYKEVPNNVKTGLANLKSVMRKSLRKRRGKKAAEEAAQSPGANQPPTVHLLSRTKADTKLEQLEMLIDECMTQAKILDREGLDNVIRVLRRARNEVVWKLGDEK
jgi:hypothetical protein